MPPHPIGVYPMVILLRGLVLDAEGFFSVEEEKILFEEEAVLMMMDA